MSNGLTFLAYSTHSNGRSDKPGIRARLVIPVDRSLTSDEYKAAWHGVDLMFCGGAIAAADDSGKAMWQQQGVWVAHPDRDHLAFREVHKACVASADALIAEGMKVCKPKVERREYVAPKLPVTAEIQRLESALIYLDAETTSVWTSLMMAFKALTSEIGYDPALLLAVRYSEQAGEDAKAKNDDKRYDPATFFDNAAPVMDAEVAKGVIYGAARDGALSVVDRDLKAGGLSNAGVAAVAYLRCYHFKALREVCARFGLEAAA